MTAMATPEPPKARPVLLPRKRLWAVFVTVVALTALGFFALGRLSAAPTIVPDSGPDAGFARDMQTHHAQAVEMALLIRDKSANPEIRAIAYDIATAQQHQIGQMFAWLQDWGLSQAGTTAPMAWMTTGAAHEGTGAPHGAQGSGPEGAMEGMATPEQMQGLRESSGAQADRLFVELMTRHHQGGVAMASAGTRLAETSKVRDFAARIVEAQTTEITALEELRGRL